MGEIPSAGQEFVATIALEQHPDSAAARGEDPGDGGAFVLISEAYATLADESHRASYDAMRGCRGCCVELGDVVKMVRGSPGPVRLRFFEPPLCELSDYRRGAGAVRSFEGDGCAVGARSEPRSACAVAAAPSMSRLGNRANDGLRFAATRRPRGAALQDDAEAQLLVAIALVRINTTGERRKALQHAERAAGAAARSATRGKSGTREQDMAKTLVSSEAAYLAGLMHLVDFDVAEAEKLFRAAADSFREWEQIRVYTAHASPSPPPPPPPTASVAPPAAAAPPPAPPEEIPVASPTSPTAVLAAFLFCDGGASTYSKAFNGMICSSKRDGFGSMVCFEQGSKKTQIHATEDVLEDIEYAWSQNAGHAGDDFDDMGAQVALHVAELDDEANAAALVPADYDFGDGNPLQLVERTEDF
ncbi:hypothetical protein JL720_15791 [Aureococcus anophagefferens]|nr:hypothetical protein JL720_15791 [Aureococcus anophagefferens]